MENDNILELLETYQDIVDKQDEIIRRLGKIVTRQATYLQLLKNDEEFSNAILDNEMMIANETIQQYETMKNKMEP